MSAVARTFASRCAAPALRRSSAAAGPSRLAGVASRSLATDAAPAPAPSSSATPPPPAAASSKDAAAAAAATTPPKLTGLVDAIEKLTLLEAAELVTALKTRLNITEVSMPSSSAAPAAAPAAAAPAAEEEKPKEKTIFTVKLTGLKDPTAKAKVIREVKAINSTMNLVEAKKFVESAPQTLKEGVNKEEAEKIKKAIEGAGGVIEFD